MLQKFTINSNNFLNKNIEAFYSTDYNLMGNINNPNYLNNLKNTYGKPTNSDTPAYRETETEKLKNAVTALKKVLLEDLPQISNINSLTICVVPRAKAKNTYSPNQLLFKSTVQKVISELNFNDGTNYIIRNTDTKTTHLPDSTPNYSNDGSMPYKGITMNTCIISDNVKDKNILLIDDIYTHGVNIDEDAIQALLDTGAKSVIFYAVAKA